tara:strand:+ start:232 stop:540 length:309 start_codon:yes stop_codon:yes gene_type:complete
MSSDQFHLCKIAEECAEVAQRALKAQQFGLGEVQSGQDLTNLERLIAEFHDLFVTFDNFLDLIEGDHGIEPTPAQARHRLQKMQKFLDLSISLKQVEDTAVI